MIRQIILPDLSECQFQLLHVTFAVSTLNISYICVYICGIYMYRYAPVYWCEMKNLPTTHPWISQQILQNPGCWTYQRHARHGFSSIAADQTIEQTNNRESKSAGGIKGITLRKG